MTFLAAGFVLLLLSELAGLAAIRIAAVVLLVGGAVGVGIAAGLKPRSAGMLERVAGMFSRAAVCVVALILVAPVLIVLMASVAGVAVHLFDPDSIAGTPLVMTGGVIGLLLLTATVAGLVVGIVAIRGTKPDPAARD